MAYQCWKRGEEQKVMRVQAESVDVAATMYARLVLGPPMLTSAPPVTFVFVRDDALVPDTYMFSVRPSGRLWTVRLESIADPYGRPRALRGDGPPLDR